MFRGKLCVYLAKAAFAALLLVGLSSNASAQNWYGGFGVGQSKADVDCDPDYTAIFADISCSADDTGTGWKLFLGNQFNPNVAVEFGYVDLGEFKLTGLDSFFGSTLATAEANGFNVAIVGSSPASSNTVFMGKIGLFMWNADVTINTSNFGSASEDDSGTDLMIGFGARFNFSKNFGLRVEWERFMDVGDEDTTGQSDVDLLSASLVFNF